MKLLDILKEVIDEEIRKKEKLNKRGMFKSVYDFESKPGYVLKTLLELALPIEKYEGDISKFDGFKNYNIKDVVTDLNANKDVDMKIGKGDLGNLTYYLLLANDKIIAGLNIDSDTGQVESSETHPLVRGKGYANILYTTVNDDVYKNTKKTLKSDNLLSSDAIRFWDNLVSKGKARVIGKSTQRDHNTYEMVK